MDRKSNRPVFNRHKGQQAADVILRCLREGKSVEIEGFGIFFPGRDGQVDFAPHTAPRVFIAYAVEDAEAADQLYDALREAGMMPWMDRRNLKPGQNWPRLIESAIEASDFFLACLSTKSVSKRGGFQSEMRFALDVARKQPLESTYFVPLRLDDCSVPGRISREWQYIDLFPDWTVGIRKLVESLSHHSHRKLRRES